MENSIRIPENGQRIVEDNIKVLYHLPKRYKITAEMLEPVRHDLLEILKAIKKIRPVIWKQKYTWFIDTERIKKITGIRTRMTASKHFNYLCALGLLHKLPQTENSMIGINMEFMLETGSRRPMNVISVYRYTEKELDLVESRAAGLRSGKITQGNISKDRLVAAGLQDLAAEVYPANAEGSYFKKLSVYSKMIQAIEEQLNEAGYTNIARLSQSLNMLQEDVKKIYSIFKLQLQEKYLYKPPTNEEKELYHLTRNGWIIVKK